MAHGGHASAGTSYSIVYIQGRMIFHLYSKVEKIEKVEKVKKVEKVEKVEKVKEKRIFIG